MFNKSKDILLFDIDMLITLNFTVKLPKIYIMLENIIM